MLHNQLGCILEELAEAIRQRTEPDRSEKVDGVARVAHIVFGEHALVPLGHDGVVRLKPLLQLGNADGFCDFLHQNLDEDTTGRGGFVLVQVNNGQDTPRNRVRVQQVRKELGHVAKLVGFQSMDRAVLLRKSVHESVAPSIVVEETKACRNQTVVPQKRAFLRAALNQHVDELLFAAVGNVDASQLVSALFKGRAGHDGQVDSTAEMNEIGVGEILNDLRCFDSWNNGLFFYCFFCLLLVSVSFFVFILLVLRRGIIIVTVFFVAATADTQNFGANLAPLLFVFRVVGIDPKGIQFRFLLQVFVVQTNLVKRNLVVLFHQVQFLRNGRVRLLTALKARLAQGQQLLDAVLDPRVVHALVQEGPQPFQDGAHSGRTDLEQRVARDGEQLHGDLDRIVRERGFVQHDGEDLENEEFVHDGLVEQMSEKDHDRQALRLFLASIVSAKEQDGSFDDQFANFG